jgi:hypothetical protein
LRLEENVAGGLLARDVPAIDVAAFLRAYQIHDEVVAFDTDRLADWIMQRAADGELCDWSVFVASSTEATASALLGGHGIGLVKRTRISSASIGILVDPRHEGVDLPGSPDDFRRPSGAYDAEAMRKARPSTQGLLLVYPIDPACFDLTSVDAVIALALSLPGTSDAETAWIVNRGVEEADHG